ncbi:MAG: transglutaminase domain-containing protein, partial [Lachnospiraceae bacterium]|nr:transglutaminase domain-containing protein [Lachnospiraceae bacterium]
VLPTLYLLISEAAILLDKEEYLHRASLALIIIAVALIPGRSRPIDWTWVYVTAQRVQIAIEDTVWRIASKIDESHSIAERVGYGPLGVIGEGVDATPSHQVDLYLSQTNRSGYLYLYGSSYTDWNDNTWHNKDSDTLGAGKLILLLNTMYDAGYDREKARCFSSIQTERITYGMIRTADILKPVNTISIEPEEDEPEINEEERLVAPATEGYSYKTTYLNVDEGSPYFYGLLNRYEAGLLDGEMAAEDNRIKLCDYDILSAYFKELYDTELSVLCDESTYNCIRDNLENGLMYDGSDYEDYLTLQGSERLMELTERITEDKIFDYDKALAIRDFLREYSYNTKITPLPGDRIEQFLFYDQEGYCAHFASAMTLMLRAAGIPSRYCEGYHAALKKPGDSGRYEVTPNAAHAWTECYIEGYGWMVFEATPVIITADEASWGSLTEADSLLEEAASRLNADKEGTGSLSPEDILSESGYDPVAEHRKQMVETAKRILIVIAIIILYIAILLLIRLTVKTVRYQRLSYTERAIYHIKESASYLAKKAGLGGSEYPIRDIFACAVADAGVDIPDWVLNDYYNLRFGGEVLRSKDEVVKYKEFYKSISKRG